jgi:hypothetical protein
MKASNLYPELSKAFDPDLSIGTVAMWIEPPRPGEADRVLGDPDPRVRDQSRALRRDRRPVR